MYPKNHHNSHKNLLYNTFQHEVYPKKKNKYRKHKAETQLVKKRRSESKKKIIINVYTKVIYLFYIELKNQN